MICLLYTSDLSNRHGIALGNDEGAAVLGFAAVDALGFENVHEGRADLAGDDFDGHNVFLSAFSAVVGLVAVSYTHLDVYKRQIQYRQPAGIYRAAAARQVVQLRNRQGVRHVRGTRCV